LFSLFFGRSSLFFRQPLFVKQEYIIKANDFTFAEQMKKYVLILLLLFSVCSYKAAQAQCSICNKTAQQMGERPAKALNGGILYLAAMPFLIFGYIGYRWWRGNQGE